MIQAVSINDRLGQLKFSKPDNMIPQTKKGGITLVDSFVKNTAEEAPLLIGSAAAISLVQTKSHKIPLTKTLKNNARIFIPILLVSSAVTAIFENYITDGN